MKIFCKRTSLILSALFGPLFLLSPAAIALPWGLPLEISDANAQVGFEVDSTWHLIHGKTSALTGKVWLENEGDFASIRADINIPVKRFDTDNGSRDERLREVMEEPKFSAVNFHVNGTEGLCAPEVLASEKQCQATLLGVLKIRDISREVKIPVVLRKEGDGVTVSGSRAFDWSTFGIEDPSILVARLDKTVTVKFTLHLASLS